MCIKIRHFKIKNQKFSGEGAQPPVDTLHPIFDASPKQKSCLRHWSLCYPASQHLGENHERLRDTWRARSASLLWRSGGRAPSGVQGQSPWWGLAQGAKPPEAESIVACGRHMEKAKLPHSLYFANSIHICMIGIFVFFVSKNNYGNVRSSINVKCTVLSQSTKSMSEFYHDLGHVADVAAKNAEHNGR